MPDKQKAFSIIYHEHYQMVYQMAFHYLQNVEDAEEITQDVFVQVYQSMAKFEGKSTLKTWIYRISINKSLDYIKYKNSKKRGFIFGNKSQNEKELEHITTHDQAESTLIELEKTAVLYKVIYELPSNQKTAFILSKIEGLSHAEIAEIMEVSISSVESLVFRSKKTLQHKLAQLFDEYQKKKKK